MNELRTARTAVQYNEVYIADAGRQGVFRADAADNRSADDSSMVLVAAGGRRFKRETVNGTVDVRWFGAIAGDGGDDQPAIQKAVDFCTAHGNQYSTVHFGPGIYLIARPIILYKWNGTYAFHSTNLEGESSFWESSGNGTIIQCTFKDKFAIGIQLGKGNRISRLRITGGFKPPFKDKYSFYQMSFGDFRDPSCRDTDFSPYAAIVIDPFSNSAAQLPTDGGYPGYASWYRGNGSWSGSTGIGIEDVSINGFVVGVCSSPNAFTRNAELTNINKIQFSDTKLCISGSQDQEKGNVVTNLGCWGVTHTIFATGLYGAHTPGNWYVENANIAGFVNRFVYNLQNGYFGSHFRNIFAESLGRLGAIFSHQGTTFESSELGFAYYNIEAGQYLSPQIDCSGVTFIGCNFRMYGTFLPVTIHGSSTFDGCSFEAVPFADYAGHDYPTFVNTFVQFNQCPLGISGSRTILPAEAWQCHAYGQNTITSGAAALTTDNAAPAVAYPIDLMGGPTLLHITVQDGIRSAMIGLTPDAAGRVRKGDVICPDPDDESQGIMGAVTAVTADNFTLSYIPSWVKEGRKYYLHVFLALRTLTFLGDMTAGSNRITNVKVDFGDPGRFITLGGLMQCNKFVNKQCNPVWRRSLFRIVSYDAAARTLTLDQRATRTAAGVYFSNTNAVKDLHLENYGEGFSFLERYNTDMLVQQGGRIFTTDTAGNTVRYLVTKSGYYNASANHDQRQGEWVRADQP
jgi:pectate lyase-like protein